MVWIAVSHSTYTTLTPGSAVEIKHAWPCALYLLLLGLLRRPQQCLPRLRLALAQVTATQVSAVKVLSSPLRTDHRKSRGQRLCAILKTLRIQRSLRWPYLWLHCWWLCRRLGSGTLAPHLDGALGVHPSEWLGKVRKRAMQKGIGTYCTCSLTVFCTRKWVTCNTRNFGHRVPFHIIEWDVQVKSRLLDLT